MAGAIVVAGVMAVLAVVPEIAGVATWKWVLGAIGLALFLAGGRTRKPSSSRSNSSRG